MPTERRLSETVARCADLARRAGTAEGADPGEAIRDAVAWMAELGLPAAVVCEIVAARLRLALSDTHGEPEATAIAATIAAALDDPPWPATAPE